ncbi:hypothetical protein ES702_04610 [subsurface metagenome]
MNFESNESTQEGGSNHIWVETCTRQGTPTTIYFSREHSPH